MQIAQVMAGYSLGGADLLRRAMGKKIKEAMDAERPKFLKGAADNAVSKGKAQEVWDLLEKFANYGFNKSHAAAYAYVSYQTGWLKANHPVAFMAAVMNLDMQNTDKLAVYRQELDRMKIPLLPPDVNRSEDSFIVETVDRSELPKKKSAEGEADDDAPPARGPVECVRYALGALKNVGRDAMRRIAVERIENGPYQDLFDFARRLDLRLVGKRAIENLARAGAFDALEPNRRKVLDSVDTLVAYSAVTVDERGSNQSSLFGEAGVETPPPRLAGDHDWTPTERLAEEAAAVGFYISGHPLDDYMGALKRKRVMTYAELAASCGSGMSARIGGMVIGKQERKSQKGTKFAFVQLSDPTSIFEAVVFSETLNSARDLLEPGSGVVLSVEAEKDGDQVKLRVQGAQAIDDAVAGAASSGLEVLISSADAFPQIRASLEHAAGQSMEALAAMTETRAPRGRGPVNLVLEPADSALGAKIALPGFYPVTPQVKGALKALPGVAQVEEF